MFLVVFFKFQKDDIIFFSQSFIAYQKIEKPKSKTTKKNRWKKAIQRKTLLGNIELIQNLRSSENQIHSVRNCFWAFKIVSAHKILTPKHIVLIECYLLSKIMNKKTTHCQSKTKKRYFVNIYNGRLNFMETKHAQIEGLLLFYSAIRQ